MYSLFAQLTLGHNCHFVLHRARVAKERHPYLSLAMRAGTLFAHRAAMRLGHCDAVQS